MNIKNLIIASYLVAAVLSGCAETTPIQPVSSSKSEFKGAVYGGETTTISNVAPGVEEYRVFHQGATGFVSIQAIRADAEKRSVEFCNRKNKMMKKLRETYKDR